MIPVGFYNIVKYSEKEKPQGSQEISILRVTTRDAKNATGRTQDSN